MAERIRIFVFVLALFVIAVLTFSLSKSFSFLGSGYEVTVPPPATEEKEGILEPSPDIGIEDRNGRVLWKNYYLYPVGLVKENGGLGPDGFLSHARNLYSVHLKTGSVKRLFPRDVYIWDFFPGEFTKNAQISSLEEPKEESLLIERKLLVFAAVEDSNSDGVLNQKDAKRVFVYDPETEEFQDILPVGMEFRDLLFNTAKNSLACIVRKVPEKPKEGEKGSPVPKKKALVEFPSQVFSYDVATRKGVLAESF